MILDFLNAPIDPEVGYLLFFSAIFLYGLVMLGLIRLQERRERRERQQQK